MKARSPHWFIALALLELAISNSPLSTSFAQGTAFSYLGRLSNGAFLAPGLLPGPPFPTGTPRRTLRRWIPRPCWTNWRPFRWNNGITNGKRTTTCRTSGRWRRISKPPFIPDRDDKSISTLEFDGVELAAIQGLNQKLNEKDAAIKKLKEKADKMDSLGQQLKELRATVNQLATQK